LLQVPLIVFLNANPNLVARECKLKKEVGVNEKERNPRERWNEIERVL